MNEDTLRALIRETVARHLAAASAPPAPSVAKPLPFSAHPSHFRYTLPESSGPCYIEPGTHCSHCGYCESHGH